MRFITIGGERYPIKATVGTMTEESDRRRRCLLAAERDGRIEAAARGLTGEAAKNLIRQYQTTALREFTGRAETSLLLIVSLINAAVESERILHGRRLDVAHYPMTKEILAAIASPDDINSPDNAAAVAAELVEYYGLDEKKVTAGQLVTLSRRLTRTL